MTERTMQLRVGFLTLLAIVITVLLVFVFQNPADFFRKTYKFQVTFATARGVTAGTPVRNRGVLVGKVSDVAFSRQGGILVTVEIDQRFKIPARSTCFIKSTILGQSELDFLPTSEDRGPAPPRVEDPRRPPRVEDART